MIAREDGRIVVLCKLVKVPAVPISVATFVSVPEEVDSFAACSSVPDAVMRGAAPQGTIMRNMPMLLTAVALDGRSGRTQRAILGDVTGACTGMAGDRPVSGLVKRHTAEVCVPAHRLVLAAGDVLPHLPGAQQ